VTGYYVSRGDSRHGELDTPEAYLWSTHNPVDHLGVAAIFQHCYSVVLFLLLN